MAGDVEGLQEQQLLVATCYLKASAGTQKPGALGRKELPQTTRSWSAGLCQTDHSPGDTRLVPRRATLLHLLAGPPLF